MTTTTINQKFVRSGLQVACDRRNFHKEADKPSAMTAVTDPKEVAFYESIFKMHDERIEQKKKPIPMFKSTMLIAGENGELQQEEIVFELLDPDSARVIRSLLEKIRAPLPRGRKAGGGQTEGTDTTGAAAGAAAGAGEGGTATTTTETVAAAVSALLTEEPAAVTTAPAAAAAAPVAAAPAATVNAVASEVAAVVAPEAKAAVEAAVAATAAALPAAAAVETAVVVEKAAASSDAAKAVADLFDADEA
jgi:hypothetical protein